MAPKLNADAHRIITEFIQGRVASAGAKGVVIGTSGGLDSTLVAKLCVDALGKGCVLALILPTRDSPKEDVEHARKVVDWLDIESENISIEPMVASFRKALGPSRRELGNIKSRCRMTVLHQRAMSKGYLVCGTGNKSELLVGYFTKYGDGGVDLLPIGDLYKTQVRALARELGLPRAIVDKPPSAGLWKGQTDEGELGITYERLDDILAGVERGLTAEEISERTATPLKEVLRVEGMVESSQHKRKMPHIPKVGVRTIGIDWRE